MNLLHVDNLSFSYPCTEILREICFDVKQGENLALLGVNGAGKSTLIKCLSRILHMQSGEVYFEGNPLSRMKSREIAQRIAYVPQRQEFNRTTVFDAVLLGRKPHMGWEVTSKDLALVEELLIKLSLDHLSLRDLDTLSGGELQKVSLARALAQEPKLLLLDEPTSNLDIRNQLEVTELLSKITREEGISAVVSMHDINLALRFAHRFIMLKDGKVHAFGGKEIITPDNIHTTYDVHVCVQEIKGRPLVIPL